MGTNPINYQDTDFQSVINDINSDQSLVDTPDWWKRLIAGALDVSGEIQNAIANQSFIRTAFTRQAVSDLAQLIDYQLSPLITARGDLLFHFNPATVVFPAVLTPADIKASTSGSVSQSSQTWEARVGVTVAAFSESFTASAVTSLLTVAGTYYTGMKVRVSSTITLPPPLVSGTDYYVIYVSATTIYLATTQANAYNGSFITITGAGAGVHTITLYSFKHTCYQQKSIGSAVQLGTSDGSSSWQTFRLPDKNVLDDTLVITINSVVWNKVDSFIDSISTGKDYKIIHLQNGDAMIMFGNGIYGQVPGNFIVYANYAIGTLNSNVYALNKVNVYSGGNAYINSVTNYTILVGGQAEESMEDAKVLAPMLLKARSRAITANDVKYLCEKYPGVQRVVVNKNYYGPLSQRIAVVPSGGGAPAGALLTALQTYILDKTILESVYTVVIAASYYTVTPVATVHIFSGYTWAQVKAYFMLGLRLYFSECTKEILETYKSDNVNGISLAIAYINNKWSTTFSTTDNNAIKRMLDNVTASDFGETFQTTDVEGFLDSYVTGVDYFVLSAPTLPFTITAGQTTTDSVIAGNIIQIP